jgi:hypothetical protein
MTKDEWRQKFTKLSSEFRNLSPELRDGLWKDREIAVLEALKKEHQFYHRARWQYFVKETDDEIDEIDEIHKRWLEIEQQLKELGRVI